MAIRGENLLCKGNRYKTKEFNENFDKIDWSKGRKKDPKESKKKETK